MTSSVSNLGTLTRFTPATSCYNQQGVYHYPMGDLVQGPTDLLNCMPSNYVPSRWAYYSDTTCPPGFTIACSSLVTSGTVVAETAYTCCQSLLPLTCNPDATSYYAPWFTTLGCSTTWVFSTTIQVTSVLDNGLLSVGPFAIFSNEGIGAYSVQIRVPNTDRLTSPIIGSTTSGATNGVTSSATSGAINSVTSSVASSATSGVAHSRGLSSGAVAGIAVGSALGGIIAATVVFIWWSKRAHRRRTRGAAAWATRSPEQLNWEPPKDFNNGPRELHSQPLSEIQGASIPVELYAKPTTQ
ncbi:hypothetical protein F5B18DRAFT_617415 [Nemania serpens]|nr:hypothetical protein F5B18DRAFT_617415 [Nemania serpens]